MKDFLYRLKRRMKDFLYRLKWWLFQKNKSCKHCCLFCKHFSICVIDVTTEETIKAFDDLAKGFSKASISLDSLASAVNVTLEK